MITAARRGSDEATGRAVGTKPICATALHVASLSWTAPRSGYVLTGNPEAEAALQRQRGLVLPNAAVATNRLASVLSKSLATTRYLSVWSADHPPRVATTLRINERRKLGCHARIVVIGSCDFNSVAGPNFREVCFWITGRFLTSRLGLSDVSS
jgi:hypothetical protein